MSRTIHQETPMFSLRLKTLPVQLVLVASGVFLAYKARASEYDTDRPGGRDHPIISRYEGSILYTYRDENYGTAEIVNAVPGNGKTRLALTSLEGRISSKFYIGPKGRSPLEVFRNYQQALRNAGFEVLYFCETARCHTDDQGTLAISHFRRSGPKRSWSP